MIVDPDFLDHWRTKLLVELLNDDKAPLYVLRLWSHCQNRRASRFKLSPSALSAVCQCAANSELFESALTQSGFAVRKGAIIYALKFEKYNAKLFANWSNGDKGGRPPKKPNDNPRKTQRKPNSDLANPNVTHEEPIRVDKSRVEKIREDKTNTAPAAENFPITVAGQVDIPEPLDTKPFRAAWQNFLWHLAQKQRAMTAIAAKQKLAEMSEWGAERAVKAIEHSLGNGWLSIHEKIVGKSSKPPPGSAEHLSGIQEFLASGAT